MQDIGNLLHQHAFILQKLHGQSEQFVRNDFMGRFPGSILDHP